MKRIFIVLLFLYSTTCAMAFNPGIIVWDVEPQKIVSNLSNRLKDGWVVEEGGEVQYYGNWISYSISVKKDDPTEWYVFYDGIQDKKAFYEFYCDVIKYYSAEAVKITPSAWIGDSEIQVSIEILDAKNRSLLIYSKQPSASGIRGFGITYVKRNEGEVSISKILSGLDNRTILSLEEFTPKRHETTNVYVDRRFLVEKNIHEVKFENSNDSNVHLFFDDGLIASDDFSIPIYIRWHEGMEKYRSSIQGYIVYNGYLQFMDLNVQETEKSAIILNFRDNINYTIIIRATIPEVPSNVPIVYIQVGGRP